MKIFLSHAGPRSRAIAGALNSWLPKVIQAVKPFYSPEIEKGANWSEALDSALDGTKFGIICLTPDNLDNKWIHYEAGALWKMEEARIWTLLCGITQMDVAQPLAKFQHTMAERDDVLKLMKSINTQLAQTGIEPLSDALLVDNFNVRWPELADCLTEAESIDNSSKVKQRSDRDVLSEILEIVRNLQHPTSYELVSGTSPMGTTQFAVARKDGLPVMGDAFVWLFGAVRAHLGEGVGYKIISNSVLFTLKRAVSLALINKAIEDASLESGVELNLTFITTNEARNY